MNDLLKYVKNFAFYIALFFGVQILTRILLTWQLNDYYVAHKFISILVAAIVIGIVFYFRQPKANVQIQYYRKYPKLNIWRDDQLFLIYKGIGKIDASDPQSAFKELNIREPITDADKEFIEKLFLSKIHILELRADLCEEINEAIKLNRSMNKLMAKSVHRKETDVYVYEKIFERAIRDFNQHKNGLDQNFLDVDYIKKVGNEIYPHE
ncbi:MAG: hypothetical protein IJ575_09405 [Selenomonadaceae bacterium]|nr:hypothetical protein [Selenomonadaceae bacterium]